MKYFQQNESKTKKPKEKRLRYCYKNGRAHIDFEIRMEHINVYIERVLKNNSRFRYV